MSPFLPPGLRLPLYNWVSKNSTGFTVGWEGISKATAPGALLGKRWGWESEGNLLLSCILVHLLAPPTNTYRTPTMCQVLGAGGNGSDQVIP